MTCDICCKHPSVAGKTDFLKGCTNFKKETIKKHATSNGHIRAREKSFAEEKTIEESQIIIPNFLKDKQRHAGSRPERNGNQTKYGVLCSKRGTTLI